MRDLPELPEDIPWSPSVLAAYEILHNATTRAASLLQYGLHDPLRLKLCIEVLHNDAFPLLVALENSAEAENIPQEWLIACANCIVGYANALDSALQNAQGQYVIF
jgi:hypothetical protein